MVLKKNLTIFWISKRQTHWDLHMASLFTCHGSIAVVGGSGGAIGGGCSVMGISSRGDINNVKMSDLLAFFVMLLFPLFVFTWNSLVVEAYTSFKIIKTFIGYNNLKKSVELLFHLPLCKTILEQLLSYEVTLARKCKRTVSEQVK